MVKILLVLCDSDSLSVFCEPMCFVIPAKYPQCPFVVNSNISLTLYLNFSVNLNYYHSSYDYCYTFNPQGHFPLTWRRPGYRSRVSPSTQRCATEACSMLSSGSARRKASGHSTLGTWLFLKFIYIPTIRPPQLIFRSDQVNVTVDQ